MTTRPEPLFSRPLVPLANEEDAEVTCGVAFPRIAATDGRAYVVHVIEKAGGAPDKAGVEQREELAEDVFDIARRAADAADIELETDLRFDTDVGDAILDAASEVDASAIVFTPRGGRSWWDIFSGDVRDRLIRKSDRPVVVLPGDDVELESGSETEPDGETDGEK
ncbi:MULTISPECIES: universal stress protein [Haloferax]|uniref:Universal stress protein n=1 Tax=Haloferax marinum TaxID=2666143 RepID=A0A6A8GBL6_9EURY|nr:MULTISPECIES: universal stress protein [Haloferax]KAB1198515.1 universal stress protein [Haloferax sp. CBA1150]MRW97623.1 universal stress protein [Haloferax marinum]